MKEFMRENIHTMAEVDHILARFRLTMLSL